MTTQFIPLIPVMNVPTIPQVTTPKDKNGPVLPPGKNINDVQMPPGQLPAVRVPTVPVAPGVRVPPVHVPNVPIAPTVRVPGVNLPTVPGVRVPDIQVPGVRTPHVQIPLIPVPVVREQNVRSPGIAPAQNTGLGLVKPQTTLTLNVKIAAKDVTLRPSQVQWAARAYNILLRNHGYIDTSRMGSGKTYVVLWLAKQFGFRLLIVCPVIMIEVWKRTAAEYGVEIIDAISYQTLRSQKNHQPKHGYLERYDNVTEGGTRQVNFIATKGYTDLIEHGAFVIFDEIQNIKNNSDQYKACNALIRPILTAGGKSRFGLLSGTPFDKEEHAVNLLKLIGYIRAHRLYHYDRTTREIILEGMQELIDVCRFIDATETDRVMADIPVVKGKMNHMCYSLYTRVVKANISGAMSAPTTINGRFDVKNGFYRMTGERAQELQDAINELAAAVRFNERTGAAEIRADNIGAVTTALVHIENSKIDDFARVVTRTLENNPNNKGIVCVNYTSSVEGIANLLIFYNPLILTGKIPAVKRAAIIRTFNESINHRVLIMNTAVGGVGISLHDTIGNSPRFMFISPSYKLIELAQAAGRIYRDNTQSDATIRMFYGDGDGGRETGILTAMARKTQILKGTLDDNVLREIVLPGDYEAEIEPVN